MAYTRKQVERSVSELNLLFGQMQWNQLTKSSPSPALSRCSPILSPAISRPKTRTSSVGSLEPDIQQEIARMQRHIRSNSKASRRERTLMLRQGVRPVTPYMDFEGLRMPTDLVIMTQTRRRVIAEIRKQFIPNLAMAKLTELKAVLMPENMKNIEVAKRVVDRKRNHQDMRSRSQFANTLYGLVALPHHSKTNIKEALGEVMPEGSRFTDRRLFHN